MGEFIGKEEGLPPPIELAEERAPSLLVRRLHIGLPFDMELLVQGARPGQQSSAVCHLLYRVMRKPKQLGGWLPRVFAGWLEGMQEVDEAKRLRKQYEVGAKITAAAEQLSQLDLVEIELRGVGELMPDIDEDDP
jgi:hypothetical protein